jgi:hypothetical protein
MARITNPRQRGIDPSRLIFGPGNVYKSSQKDMKRTSFEVRNPE